MQIRAGRPGDGRHQLLNLFDAVSAGRAADFEGISVPGALTSIDEDRQEVRAWLWRVLLADGTRTFTTTGRWREALAHLEQHRGVGTRMLDGRQVAVVAALTDDDTERAAELLAGTATGAPWEQVVTDGLTVLCRSQSGEDVDDDLAALVNTYLSYTAAPGQTIFDIRLGLTVLDAVTSAEHPDARRLVDELSRRAAAARDGYAARDILANRSFNAMATSCQSQEGKALIKVCGLAEEHLPEELHSQLSASLNTSEAVIAEVLAGGLPFDQEAVIE